MNVQAIIHKEEDGGYWAEVRVLPGCATQGETLEELLVNLPEAIEGYLSVEIEAPLETGKDRIMDIAI